MRYLILFAALLPVFLLLYFINKKDGVSPEPKGEIVRALFYGVISLFLSLIISTPLLLLGVFAEQPTTILGALSTAFFGAAIPEEVAKFVMLWLFLRNNKHFDERFDCIFYAVCVSMGFAAVENVAYLFINYNSWLSVGVVRALYAVPGHFCYGVLMGYYYSLSRFPKPGFESNRAPALLLPILAHGIYNALLFMMRLNEMLAIILFIFFLLFCNNIWKFASRKIEELLKVDSEQNLDVNEEES